MPDRLLIIDASLTTRLAGELRNRGREAVTVAAVADKSLPDPDLLPTLAKEIGDRPWVLVTGDDAMPGEHGALIGELSLTVATLDPRWGASELEQEAYKREVVHRWAHRMARQREETIRRYSLGTSRPWTPLRSY